MITWPICRADHNQFPARVTNFELVNDKLRWFWACECDHFPFVIYLFAQYFSSSQGCGCWANDERAKTNGLSGCDFAAVALNGSPKTQHLRSTLRLQGALFSPIALNVMGKSAMSNHSCLGLVTGGHDKGPIAPRGQGVMPETSVSFMTTLYHFCLPE